MQVFFQNLPVTRIVDELMELKMSQETDDYRYFDPKQLRVGDSSQVPRNRTAFQEAIVFVVGGGNYIEYQNLVDYTKVRFIQHSYLDALVNVCDFSELNFWFQ